MTDKLRAVLVFGLLGVITSLFVTRLSSDALVSAVGALLGIGGTTFVLWRLVRRPIPSVWRGALLGLLIGVVSFLPGGFFMSVGLALRSPAPFELAEVFGKGVFIAIFGPLFLGWVTGPAGALLGAALEAWEARRLRIAAAQPDVDPPAA